QCRSSLLAGPCSDRRQLEYLTQIGQVSRILTHGFLRCIGNLCNRLAVTADHLHNDLQGLMAQIVREIGSDAERHAAATREMARQGDGARNRESIGKDQRFGTRVGTVGFEMRQDPLSPYERIAGIMARTVKQLAEI